MRYLLLLVILLSGCDSQPKYVNGDSVNPNEIKYFQDLRTGLCFAERGAVNAYSFACVPCDSLKRLEKFNVHYEEK